jgi:DNA-3-methyladenine glycosylase II
MDRLDAFESLVQSIAHQQVSIQAGATIFRRVQLAAGGKATPEGLLAAGGDALRAAGFSRPKAAYALDLAQKVATRDVDLPRLTQMPDEEVIAQLTSVKGIGVWTAKMFLLFHLERPDVLPHEDLGLQLAVASAYHVPRAKAAKKIRDLGPAWSPHASYASLVLWNHRRVEASLPTR